MVCCQCYFGRGIVLLNYDVEKYYNKTIRYYFVWGGISQVYSCVLFFFRPQFEGWPHHGRTFNIYLCPLILIDSFLMTIQAVRGLPRLRAPGIVPCIVSFSRQLPCFLMV